MTIDELKAQHKDNYLSQEMKCPACGKTFRKSMTLICLECSTQIFMRDDEGWVVFLDPEKLDKSKKYKVDGFRPIEEHFPGEVVEINMPFITDCNQYLYINGEETSAKRFIMPEKDVKLTCRIESNMMQRPGNAPMGMMGMMSLGSMMDVQNQGLPAGDNVGTLQEETVTCLSCGKTVPHRKFCRECGSAL